MKSQPKVGLAAIIHHNGKVLLGKRKGTHGNSTWGMPGGHLEMGESLEECIEREVMEETGLIVTSIKFAAVTNDIFSPEKQYITIFMTCEYKSGKIKDEPGKMENWQWFEWDNLPTPLFLPIINLKKQQFDPFHL